MGGCKNNRKLKRKGMVLTSICIVSCVASSFSGCSLASGNSKKPALIEPVAIKYSTYDVKKGSISKYFSSDGVFTPCKVEKVSFRKANGSIKCFNAKVGQMVKKDQILAELDSDNIINDIKVQEINLQKIQLRYDRMMKSQASADNECKEIELEINNAKFDLENLKKDLEKTKLLSPINGRVINKIDQDAGENVGENEAVYVIADNNSMKIECIGNEALNFKADNIVNCKYKGSAFKGKVEKIETKKDFSYMYVAVEKVPSDAQLGGSVKVTFDIGKKDNVIVIPKRLIKKSGKVSIVQVLENNKKVDKFVEVGIENDMESEIVSGLKEGEKLIQ